MHAQPQAHTVLLRSAARWFLVVLTLGVILRSAFVWAYTPGPFLWGNLIHAHSHTAYFGWAGLGLMGLILWVLPRLTGRPVAHSASLRWMLRLAPVAVTGQLLAFAGQGYTALAIAFSALNEVVWFLFAAAFWREVRAIPLRRWPPALWLIGTAVGLLLLSTAGTLLVIIFTVVLQTSDPVLGNLGIYLFLQAYGDGWLEVGAMGVIAALLPGALPDRRRAAWQSWLFLLLMAPAALRLLAPFGLAGPTLTLSVLAGAGLGIAQVLFVGSIPWGSLPVAARPWWLLAGGGLLAKAGMELIPLLPGWIALATSRSLVIAFLHWKLLLIVSAALIGAMTLYRSERPSRGPFALFAGGSLLMIGALAAHGFWADGNLPLGAALYATAFGGGLVSATGAAWAVWPGAARRSVQAEARGAGR